MQIAGLLLQIQFSMSVCTYPNCFQIPDNSIRISDARQAIAGAYQSLGFLYMSWYY